MKRAPFKFLIITLTISLILGIGTLALCKILQKNTADRVYKELTGRLSEQKNAIAVYYADYDTAIKSCTAHEALHPTLHDKELTAQNAEELLTSCQLHSNNKFSALLIVDRAYEVLASSTTLIRPGTKLIGGPFSTTNIGKTLYESYLFADTLFSTYYSSPQTEVETLFLSSPLVINAQLKGFIIGQLPIHTEQILQPHENDPFKAAWYLVEQINDEFNIITSSGMQHSLSISQPIPRSILEKSLSQEPGFELFVDANGSHQLTIWEFFPSLGWGIINTANIEPEYAPEKTLYSFAMLLFILAGISALLILLFWLYRLLYVHEYPDEVRSFLHLITRTAFLYVALIVGATVLVISISKQRSLSEAALKQFLNKTELKLQSKAQELDYILFEIQQTATNYQQTINDELHNRAALSSILEKAMLENPAITGITLAFAPTDSGELFAPTIIKTESGLQTINYAELYDYSQQIQEPALRWYQQATEYPDRWSDPYQVRFFDKPIMTYALPIHDQDKKVIAVLGVHFSLNFLNNITADLYSADNGLTLLINREGKLLYQTAEDTSTKNAIVARMSNELFNELKTAVLKHDQGYFEQQTVHGKWWVWSQPIAHRNWILISIMQPTASNLPTNLQKFHVISIVSWVGIAIVVLLLLMHLLPIQSIRKTPIAAGCTLLFITGISFIWMSSFKQNERIPEHFSAIQNITDLDNFIDFVARIDQKEKQPMRIAIPTAITVTSLRLGDDTAEMNGRIQQTIPVNLENKLTPGIRFPGAEETRIAEAVKIHKGDKVIITWDFYCKFSSSLDYRLFPLDKQCIELTVQSIEQAVPVILVPDSKHQDFFEGDKTMAGYIVTGAQIGYILPNSTKVTKTIQDGHFPLRFMIMLERDLLYSFIVYFIPLFIIFLALFGLTYLISQAQSLATMQLIPRDKIVDTGNSSIAGYVAILFSLVLMHQSVRTKASSSSLIYLEYFFFLAYLLTVIFIVITLTVVLHAKYDYKIESIVLAKRTYLFWPIISLIWFIITAWTFYNA